MIASDAPKTRYVCCLPPPPPSVANLTPQISHVQAASATVQHIWDHYEKLTYCFVNGDGEECTYLSNPDAKTQTSMEIVRLAWQNWKDTGINLTFQEVTVPSEATIRIAFIQNKCSYSAVGRDSVVLFKNTQHTMNFGYALEEQPSTAEHEIGHALGLRHEHQNPNAGIEWNTQQVLYNYHESWDKSAIVRNILSKIAGPGETTAWDPDSIMHYKIVKGEVNKPVEYAEGYEPAYFKTCKYDAATNTLISGLSARDKELILKLYPPEVPGNTPLIQEQPVKFNLPGSAEGNRVGFEFQPPVSGDYTFSIQGPDNTNPVKSTVMVRNNRSEYVLDKDYISANSDVDSRLVLPVKARPYLSADEKYFVTALFDKSAIGSFALKAMFGKQTVDIVNNLGGYIGQNMRSGITVVNTTSSDIMVSITKDIRTDSAGWTTIKPGQQDRWGRAAKEYTIDLIVEGEQRTLKIKKEGEETIIFVNSCNDIEVRKAEVLKRL